MCSLQFTVVQWNLSIKGTFKLYNGNTFLPLKEDNLSIMDKMIRPNVSVIPLYYNLMCRASFAMSQHFV